MYPSSGSNSLPARPPPRNSGFKAGFTPNVRQAPSYPRPPVAQHGASYNNKPEYSGYAAGYAGYNTEPDEYAAQLAEWQSAYVPRDPEAKVEPPPKAPEVAKPDKTVVRHGGGKKWTDDTLLEWDPSHLRLFVGNLGGETTDEALLKAFSRWTSVQKARVVRDKRTNKSKGYGFVSFSDADDFFQAAKEMNNKYIQNRPVVVRKANTEIKVTNVKDKNKKQERLGPKGGIVKPGQKTKNGLRLLG